MNDFLTGLSADVWVTSGIVLLVFALLALVMMRRRKPRTFASVLKAIAFEHLQGIVIPMVDEGEIQIDHLLLTPQGLLVLEVKDVNGVVFGGDKMQDWTVIGEKNRFTFSNPQPGLYDRVAAVRHIVRQVPVVGRIVFLDGASFTKGIPSQVCNLDDLQTEFGEQDSAAAAAKIEAFKPHWEQIQTQLQ